MRLLERETPLASLVEYVNEARRGEGRLVLVGGEAGVGKSALVERLAQDVPDARWSWGACDGLFTPRPLGPLFDIAADLGGELLELCRARASREELFDALLHRLLEPQLDVVVMEDVHWADEATVDLLRFLGRRLRHAPAVLLATYRDDGLSAMHPLRLALGELASQRSTRRVGLGPLSSDAVADMAYGTGYEPAELYRLTGGNPFYVTEVVRGGGGALPPSARDAVLARVARLSDESREVLAVAALIGSRVDLSLLASVTAGPVDELVTSGLLVSEGGSLRFAHEIARIAVEETVAAYRRTGLHARILAAMVALASEDDAGMAHHADQAGDGEAALTYAHRAAQRASELASHREAAAQYERALRFASGTAPAFAPALYDALANELSLIDEWPAAAAAGERALALWRVAGDKLREGDTLRVLSNSLWRLCRGAEADAAVEAAVVTLEPLGPTRELSWAYNALALGRWGQGAFEDAIALAKRARAVAEPLGVTDAVSDALNTEGSVRSFIGEDGLGLIGQSLAVAVEHGHEAQAGRAFVNLYSTLLVERRFTEAELYYVDGHAYCVDHELATYGNCLRGSKSGALEKLGRWDEAVELATWSLDRLGPAIINRIQFLGSRGIIAARRGDVQCWEDIHEAVGLGDGTGEGSWKIFAQLAVIEAHWLHGDLDRARLAAEAAARYVPACDAWDRGAIAVWLRRAGSTHEVVGDIAEPYRLELAGHWDKAAQLWTDFDCRYEAALVLLDSADEAALRRAVGIFDELGAKPAVRIAQQRMRALGIRSVPNGAQAATRSHPLGLTRREQEVLDLLGDGRTNAEIAAALVIAEKTVDHHVSAVLAKLGAPTRSAAVTVAAQHGLVGRGRK